MKTIITPQTPSEDEFAIVATFSNEVTQQINSIQKELNQLLGDAIWLTPSNALHSTLMEIICDREYIGRSRKEYFDEWYMQYNQKVHEVISGLSAFELLYSELEVSQRAIIIKSKRANAFNSIRSALLEETTLPEGTKLPPNITHCTLARFNQVLDLQTITEQTQNLQCNISVPVTNFKLLKDLGPPTFEPKTIEVYSLGI